MAANITYRASSTPVVPGTTTVKNSPLTNLEMDANLKALVDDVGASIVAERSVISTLTNKTIDNANNTILNVSLTNSVAGILPVLNGGTGANNGVPLATAVTGVLAVANGGTGTTTSTGTGSVVRSLGPTIDLASSTGLPLTTGVTGILPVLNGGTGSSTAAGSRTNLGAAESGNNTTITNIAPTTTIGGVGVIGYRDVPQVTFSVDTTLTLTDASKHLFHPSADITARTLTIPANAAVAFPIGTVVTVVNHNGAGALSIAITTDVMRMAGPGTLGTRTLAANGMCTIIKLTATEWIISGVGLT